MASSMQGVLNKILKWLVYVSAACIMLLALLVGIARLFLPLVPEYQDDIRRWAADATGFDVRFQNISASWPFAGPELRFIDVVVSSQETGEQILFADNLTAGISLLMLIRDRKALLNRLGVKGAQIRVQRDVDGTFLFQDRPLDEFIQLETDRDKPLRLPDLLITLSDIDVQFADHQRSDDEYVFGVEQLDIELSTEQVMLDGEILLAPEFGRHATISADIPTQLLFPEPEQAESINRRSVARAEQEWRIFFDSEDLHLGEILTYALNRDAPVSETHGDVTISAAFGNRKPQSISAEFDITDVVLRIDDDRTARHEVLRGRLEWARDGDNGWLLAGTDIGVRGRDLFAPRSDFAIALQPAGPDRGLSIKANATFLRLQDLYPFIRVAEYEGLLTDSLPEELQLPQAISGDVQNLKFDMHGMIDAPAKYIVALQFADIGVTGLAGDISTRGLSGELAADDDGGRVQVDSQAIEVELPALFTAPLEAQSMTGLLVWRVNDDVIHVLSDNVRVQTAFIEGDSRFEFDWPRNGDSPRIDLMATGTASDARGIVPFLPLKKFPPKVGGWLDRALVAGRVSRADIEFSGPLREFPFDADEGVFYIDIDIEDGILDYADGWPRIDNMDARLVFDGVSLASQRNSGRIGRIGFRDSDVRIADLRKGRLEISEQQPVAVDAGLNFLQRSPVADAIGPIIGKVTGSGTINADLQLVVPVMRPAEYKLDLLLDTNGTILGMTGIDWGLADLDGSVTVRNTRFYADGITATLLGEPVTLDMRPGTDSSDLYGQIIRFAGRTPVERWMQALSLPFAGQVDGPADWNALVLIPQQQPEVRPPVHIIARSDLIGVESRMPAPLAKEPVEPAAFEIDIAFPAEDQLEVGGRLRSALTWAFELESVEETWRIKRGGVHAGTAAAILPAGRGVELSGHLEFVRFDDWLTLMESDAEDDSADAGLAPPDWQETWREATLDIDRLSAFGLLFTEVQLDARQDEQNWQIVLDAPAIAGQITVPLDLDTGRPIDLDMERLWLVDTESDGQGDAESADPRAVPSVNIEAADFIINDMHFGSLSTTIKSVAAGILVEPIRMQAQTFTIDGDATWLVDPNDESLRQSRLALTLNGTDIEAALIALGYDPVIEGESINATGDLTWLGGPRGDFLERADGQFSIGMKNGSLLAVDPGGGRLLGVLSLAALPRRLSFDFSDVFDEGLGFDSLKGDFTVDDGNAYTCNLGMEGSVADMGIVGRAGIEARDYDQLAVVRPHVSNLLAVGGTVVGGPVVGAAMLLFSQIFHKPLSTLGESYYRVTGSWDDPLVEQIRGNDLDVTPLRNCESYLSDAVTESLKQ